jgi:hypothetical protein
VLQGGGRDCTSFCERVARKIAVKDLVEVVDSYKLLFIVGS